MTFGASRSPRLCHPSLGIDTPNGPNEHSEPLGIFSPGLSQGGRSTGGGSVSGMGTGAISVAAYRDLKTEVERLRKENERKTHRIESLQREMTSFHATSTQAQRELKVLVGANEKLQVERDQARSQAQRQRSSIGDLNQKLSDAKAKSAHIETIAVQDDRIAALTEEISVLRGELTLREDTLRTVRYELNVAHRSLATQNKFETPMGITREKLRELYMDCGRLQTDLHTVSCALAEVQSDYDGIRQELAQMTVSSLTEADGRAIAENMVVSLKKDYETLQHEKTSLLELVTAANEGRQKLEVQIEDLVKRMTSERTSAEEVYAKKQCELEEAIRHNNHLVEERTDLHNQLELQNIELESLRGRLIESEQSSIATRDLLADEVVRLRKALQALEDKYADQQRLLVEVQTKNTELISELSSSEERKQSQEKTLFEKLAELHYLQHTSRTQSSEIEKLTKEAQTNNQSRLDLIDQRDKFAVSLKQGVEVIRQLKEKLQNEMDARLDAEKQVKELKEARVNMSSAILDALHNERMKNASLVASLANLQEACPATPPRPPHQYPLDQVPVIPTDSTRSSQARDQLFDWLANDTPVKTLQEIVASGD